MCDSPDSEYKKKSFVHLWRIVIVSPKGTGCDRVRWAVQLSEGWKHPCPDQGPVRSFCVFNPLYLNYDRNSYFFSFQPILIHTAFYVSCTMNFHDLILVVGGPNGMVYTCSNPLAYRGDEGQPGWLGDDSEGLRVSMEFLPGYPHDLGNLHSFEKGLLGNGLVS